MNAPRFVLRASYGNDSVALIQLVREWGLDGVTVLYSDTGWARQNWAERVAAMEAWVTSIGFDAARTTSVGMEALVRSKKMWPQRLMQFCTKELKIKPTIEWLATNDPERKAIILTGVRREESAHRKAHPSFILCSANDGGRTVISPLAECAEEERNALIRRAGFEPLPHRSEECKCINSGRADISRWDAGDIAEIKRIEDSLGYSSKGKPRTMFRPNKFMGASGIEEIKKWAHSPRGEYEPPDEAGEPCDTGWCER